MNQRNEYSQVHQSNVKSLQELKDWLTKKGIDFSRWGSGSTKTVKHLWQEIVDQEICLQDNPPLRISAIVQIIIRRGDRILIEVEQEFDDNRSRPRNRPPTEKMKYSESYLDTASRCLQEELSLKPHQFQIINATYQRREEHLESSSYPGLCTRYILHIVEAKVNKLPDTDFWTDEGSESRSDAIKKHHWAWTMTP